LCRCFLKTSALSEATSSSKPIFSSCRKSREQAEGSVTACSAREGLFPRHRAELRSRSGAGAATGTGQAGRLPRLSPRACYSVPPCSFLPETAPYPALLLLGRLQRPVTAALSTSKGPFQPKALHDSVRRAGRSCQHTPGALLPALFHLHRSLKDVKRSVTTRPVTSLPAVFLSLKTCCQASQNHLPGCRVGTSHTSSGLQQPPEQS